MWFICSVHSWNMLWAWEGYHLHHVFFVLFWIIFCKKTVLHVCHFISQNLQPKSVHLNRVKSSWLPIWHRSSDSHNSPSFTYCMRQIRKYSRVKMFSAYMPACMLVYLHFQYTVIKRLYTRNLTTVSAIGIHF